MVLLLDGNLCVLMHGKWSPSYLLVLVCCLTMMFGFISFTSLKNLSVMMTKFVTLFNGIYFLKWFSSYCYNMKMVYSLISYIFFKISSYTSFAFLYSGIWIIVLCFFILFFWDASICPDLLFEMLTSNILSPCLRWATHLSAALVPFSLSTLFQQCRVWRSHWVWRIFQAWVLLGGCKELLLMLVDLELMKQNLIIAWLKCKFSHLLIALESFPIYYFSLW